MHLGTPNLDKASSWIKSLTMKVVPTQFVAATFVNVNPIKVLAVSMKITKLDRRFSLYQTGFTHQIKNTTQSERYEIESYFRKKYGPSSDFIWTHGISVRDYNMNWRSERQKRRFSGGTKIYVKHEQDLIWLALKFSQQIG